VSGSPSESPGDAGERESAVLLRARVLAASLAAGALALAAASGFATTGQAQTHLGSVAALSGLVSPLIGFRLFAWLRERVPPDSSHSARCSAFLRATLLALGVGEGVALFGIVAYWLDAGPGALIGVVTLVILVGALWPGPERLQTFLEAAEAENGATP